MDRGALPWWTAEDLRHKSFRYLSVLTMQLDFRLWPERPAWMHLHSILWLAALVVACAWLYRQTLGPTWVAGLAALLYALEDAHAAPTAYLANRYALIATFLGVLSLGCFVRWRTAGWRAGALASPVFLALALCAGEIALATLGYLGAFALFAERGPLWRRVRVLWPHAAVACVWAAVYSGFAFGAGGSGFYVDPLRDPAGFLAALWQRAPILLLGQWTPVAADFAGVSDPTQNPTHGLQLAGLAVVGVLAVLLAPRLRRDPAARFWAAGALLALVPISATGPQNRLLFFVGIGSMALLAMLVDDWVDARRRGASRWWTWPAGAVVGLLLLSHLVLAPVAGWVILHLQSQANEALMRAMETLPGDPALAEQNLVLVNPPDHTYTVGTIPVIRGVAGEPVPDRIRVLSVGASPVHVTRVDARTLDVHIEYGLFSTPISRYFRSGVRGFEIGQRLAIADLEVEVLSLAPNRGPDRLRYRFAVPLEDPSLRWMAWQGRERVWAPLVLPRVGETVSLPPSRGIFDP